MSSKHWNSFIRLPGKDELEKQYAREIQNLCKNPAFGMVKKDLLPGDVAKTPLDSTKDMASTTVPLIGSMVVSLGPSRPSRNPQLAATKIIAILVILCGSAHRNNSNYLPLLIALYVYSAGARVNAITLLNHLGPPVSYDVLQKKKAKKHYIYQHSVD